MLRILSIFIVILIATPAHAVDPDEFIGLEFRQEKQKAKVTAPEPASKAEASVEIFKDPRAGQVWTDPVTGMQFVRVPGGCYMMGSDKGDGSEQPVHKVCIDGFWMGKYEVTQREWKRVMGDNPSYFKEDRNPVEQVSWNDVMTFLRRLNSKGQGRFRLPTEAEWEYSCRAGTTGTRFWGESEGDACRYANAADKAAYNKRPYGTPSYFPCDDGYARVAPVGSLKPNRFGLYDMQGNVMEWCADSYDSKAYSGHAARNPQHSGGSGNRVVRGGSWLDAPGNVRSAARYSCSPDDANNYHIGFRIVREE